MNKGPGRATGMQRMVVPRILDLVGGPGKPGMPSEVFGIACERPERRLDQWKDQRNEQQDGRATEAGQKGVRSRKASVLMGAIRAILEELLFRGGPSEGRISS